MLVTSRAPLHVSAEREYRLEPLTTSDAAALFVERARAVGRELAPDATVEAICHRLDGLPLAVELAAARTKLLAPARLLERLDSALPLLTGGARDAPERQRTLRATIEWSYDLLDVASKELFARLSVFAGSFPIGAAEEICDADLDGLAALVDSSLLKPIGDDRFLMLETIREYALERARSLGSGRGASPATCTFLLRTRRGGVRATLRRRVGVVCAARSRPRRPSWRARLARRERPGSRARARRCARLVLAVARASSRKGGGRLAGALTGRLQLVEFERAHSLRRGHSRRGAAKSTRDEHRSISRSGLWRELDDRNELASALDALGWLLAYNAADTRRAFDAFEQSLQLRRELGDRPGETRALVGVCQMLVAAGEVERAESLSLGAARSCADADPRTEHFAYHFLADCALTRGNTEEAETALPRKPAGGASARTTSSRRASRSKASRWRLPVTPTRGAHCYWPVRSRRSGVTRHLDFRRFLGHPARAIHRRRPRAAGRGGGCRLVGRARAGVRRRREARPNALKSRSRRRSRGSDASAAGNRKAPRLRGFPLRNASSRPP